MLNLMAAVHRAVFIWLWLLIFLVLLVLRLDQKIVWNWFAIFFPMWVLNMVFTAYSIVNVIDQSRRFRQQSNAGGTTNNTFRSPTLRIDLRRSFTRLIGILLKLTFEICLCIKLEYDFVGFRLVYVMIPFWILMIAILTDLWMRLNVVRLHAN